MIFGDLVCKINNIKCHGAFNNLDITGGCFQFHLIVGTGARMSVFHPWTQKCYSWLILKVNSSRLKRCRKFCLWCHMTLTYLFNLAVKCPRIFR